MDNITFDSMLNIIREITTDDTSIAVANSKQFIYYHPSKRINLNIQPGDDIHEDTVTYKALIYRKKTSDYIGEHVFGTPYYGISVPIIQNGQPQGCVTSILPGKMSSFITPFLTIQVDDRWIPTSFENIIYIESQHRKTNVQSVDYFGQHKLNLTQLEWLLPNSFMRCHRSFIVNMNHIAEIHPDSHSTFMLILTDGYRVPVSQTYASKFRQLLYF